MIPNLGEYATEVLLAYGAALLLLLMISGYSCWVSERTRRRLSSLLDKRDNNE